MASLGELAGLLNDADREQAAELWPTSHAPQPLPAMRRLAEEVGDDALLAEAALAWVKLKKQELLWAKFGVFYTPQQLEAMKKAAEESV